MALSNEKIIAAALALPRELREMLIERLLQSLATNEPECRPAWIAEIRRRLEEVRSGRVQTIPSDEAIDRVVRFCSEAEVEYRQTVEAIREGLDDFKAGRVTPLRDLLANESEL